MEHVPPNLVESSDPEKPGRLSTEAAPALPPEDIARGHEQKDASVKGLIIFIVCFVIGVAGIHYITLKVWESLNVWQNRHDPFYGQTNPVAAVVDNAPPEPRLEPSLWNPKTPEQDLQDVNQEQLEELHTWKWSDASHRFAQIPIETAMRLAVEQGIPLKLPATQPTAPPGLPNASAVHGPNTEAP